MKATNVRIYDNIQTIVFQTEQTEHQLVCNTPAEFNDMLYRVFHIVNSPVKDIYAGTDLTTYKH